MEESDREAGTPVMAASGQAKGLAMAMIPMHREWSEENVGGNDE